MSAAVIILAQRHRHIRIFREAGATTASTAIVPSEYGIRNSFIFRRLVRDGVLVPVGHQRYYLNEVREEEFKKRRLWIGVALLVVVFIAYVIAKLAEMNAGIHN